MDPTTAILVVAAVTIPLHIAVAWYFHTKSSGTQELKERLQNLTQQFDTKIGQQTQVIDNKLNKTVKSQMEDSRELIKDITEEISEVKETNKDVLDITESLEDLESVLKNQKERGALGEAGLELILENMLEPSAFDLQYNFADGDAVDAIIRAKDGIIPVDAKFPLSNYQRLMEAEDDDKRDKIAKQFKRDVKERIKETAKYIRPDEDTLPFALMYVPAEGVYYDLLVNKVGQASANTRNLIEFAQEKNVIIVSPTTMAAYLHTILQGLRAFRIEKNAEQIQEGIESLRKHLKSYEEHHQRLGKNLNAVVNKYDKSSVKLRGIGRDVRQIADGEFELDGIDVDNPQLDDNS
jgi:DNA recombination protein RmuC